MKRIPIAILVLAIISYGQNFRWTYDAGYQVTSTSAKVTLQLPANSTNWARPLFANISCPTAVCSAQIIRGGTAATATAGTPVVTRTATPDPGQALFYTASDSTGGTALPVQPLGQGTSVVTLDDIEMRSGERISLLVTGSSQVVTINLMYEEYPH